LGVTLATRMPAGLDVNFTKVLSKFFNERGPFTFQKRDGAVPVLEQSFSLTGYNNERNLR
jgi:hypothetical protein